MAEWKLYGFEELKPGLLYEILALRAEVFVAEQNCPYKDPDGVDIHAFHLCGFEDRQIIAYARIIPPGIVYQESGIGRVLSKLSHRRTGVGKELMAEAIKTCFSKFPHSDIRIGAQLYLQKFYERLGFQKMSDVYLEDNIPHITMQLIKSIPALQ